MQLGTAVTTPRAQPNPTTEEPRVMADTPDNTEAAFDEKWASATEVGEYLTQINDGAWDRAPDIIQEAVIGGCLAALELIRDGQIYFVDLPSELALKFWSS